MKNSSFPASSILTRHYGVSRANSQCSLSVLGKRVSHSCGIADRLENKRAPLGWYRTRLHHNERTRFAMADSPHRDIYAYLNSPKGAAIEARFWCMVYRGPPEACWDWQASRAPSGYGRFKIASFEARHSNRVAWAIANRAEPGDLIIRHTCDRPQCCNPAHLLIGTPLDNARDKVERGRCGTSE